MSSLKFFSLVLHSHLPYVMHHGRWPHGSDWLCEIATQCYLPLLATFSDLKRDGIPFHLTMNLSPVLCEQLAMKDFQTELTQFLLKRMEACEENRYEFVGEESLERLTAFWRGFYEEVLETFQEMGGDLVGAFRKWEEGGFIEIITCPATHGYLPLLSLDESIQLQLTVARKTHLKHFGKAPRGIWLPECAYRPRGKWSSPVGTPEPFLNRRGIEEFLGEEGFEYFVVDHSLLSGGEPLFSSGELFLRSEPVRARPEKSPAKETGVPSPYRVYAVASEGGSHVLNAFVRDPETTLQVWSREGGYPGDGLYLDFHKKHFPGGIKYWRVTDPKADLADKFLYEPSKAREQTWLHANHFAQLVARSLATAKEGDEILCSPYDTELFGHWWFEGPRWLYEVFKALSLHKEILTTTCSGYLDRSKEALVGRPVIRLREGSWGEGGDHRVWVNAETTWTWREVYEMERRFHAFSQSVRGQRPSNPFLTRLLSQLTREFLLLEASDWQFLITTWSARDYAEQRFSEHVSGTRWLLQLGEQVLHGGNVAAEDENHLATLEATDPVFATV